MNATAKTEIRSYHGGFFKTIISPDQTNDEQAIIEFNLPKGAEPPLHIHKNEDESFYVLEGTISVRVGDEETVLQAGDAIFAPKNTPHGFTILSEKVRFLNLITPGKLWNYFIEFSRPFDENAAPDSENSKPDAAAIQRMIERTTSAYQIDFVM